MHYTSIRPGKSALLLILMLAITFNVFSQKKARKAVFIIADGIPADVIEKVPTPALDKITAAGSYMRAYVGGEVNGYSQTPTISSVSYNSLITGTWVNKHNVWDNDIAAPNYNYWTIFRMFKSIKPKGTTGIFSSWTDNRTKLIGEGMAQTGNIKMDFVYDGYELDTARFPHDKSRDFMLRIDETVIDSAASCIRKNAPDLSWIYLEYTDDMGHMYGDSPQFYNGVKKLDAQLGRIWDAIQYRQKQFGEEWMIVITTDHGRDEKTGKDHGGHTPRQRSTWIATNVKGLNTYATHYKPGITDILPTIARFMHFEIPAEQKRELDGVPLIGKVSLSNLNANLIQNNLDISWQAHGSGTAKVYVTTTNNFKTGGKDEYKLLAQVPLTNERVLIDVSKMPSEFYKVVIEAPENVVNRWAGEVRGER